MGGKSSVMELNSKLLSKFRVNNGGRFSSLLTIYPGKPCSIENKCSGKSIVTLFYGETFSGKSRYWTMKYGCSSIGIGNPSVGHYIIGYRVSDNFKPSVRLEYFTCDNIIIIDSFSPDGFSIPIKELLHLIYYGCNLINNNGSGLPLKVWIFSLYKPCQWLKYCMDKPSSKPYLFSLLKSIDYYYLFRERNVIRYLHIEEYEGSICETMQRKGTPKYTLEETDSCFHSLEWKGYLTYWGLRKLHVTLCDLFPLELCLIIIYKYFDCYRTFSLGNNVTPLI